MKTGHTEGLWSHEPIKAYDLSAGFYIRDEGGHVIARVSSGAGGPAVGQANARLMATAPKLLAMLGEVRERLVQFASAVGVEYVGSTPITEIDAVIQEATGEQQ